MGLAFGLLRTVRSWEQELEMGIQKKMQQEKQILLRREERKNNWETRNITKKPDKAGETRNEKETKDRQSKERA